MEIDMKQFRAAIKSAAGSGRPQNDYIRGYRHGIEDGLMFVKRLSSGWQYVDGKWIQPQSEGKP